MLLSFILCNFLVRMFSCPQKVQKTNPKSCILMAVGSFFLCSPDCPKQSRTSFQFHKFFYPIVSAKVSGLGSEKCQFFLTFITIHADVGWLGGSEKVQKYADVIQGWSLNSDTVRNMKFLRILNGEFAILNVRFRFR